MYLVPADHYHRDNEAVPRFASGRKVVAAANVKSPTV